MATVPRVMLDEAAGRAPGPAVEAAAQLLADAGNHPTTAPFITRAMKLMAALAEQIGPDDLSTDASAASDYETVLRTLSRPEALAMLRVPSGGSDVETKQRLWKARLRGLMEQTRLLDFEGGTISASEAGAVLHLTRQAVDKRRRAGKLVALKFGRRGYAYPVWQFASGGTLPGLEQVLAVIQWDDSWMQAVFILGNNARLDGERPLDMLRRGDIDAVVRAARAYGEHGAA